MRPDIAGLDTFRSINRWFAEVPMEDDLFDTIADPPHESPIQPSEVLARRSTWSADGFSLILAHGEIFRLARLDLPLVLVAPGLAQAIADHLALCSDFTATFGDAHRQSVGTPAERARFKGIIWPSLHRIGMHLILANYDLTPRGIMARIDHDPITRINTCCVVCEVLVEALGKIRTALPPAQIDTAAILGGMR